MARNYEPRSVASGETTEVLIFLMDQPSPSPAVRSTVEGGVSWPQEAALRDHAAEGTERPCAVVRRR
ncbi:pectate lyase [Novosphingobium lindaniclasticum]|uniref:pectate lyase n=1 Tax=Novosphingobium lindaniclasticum TaxID=1329895 RepID=UPI0024096BEF|nr:pectate lyase [Novosphingobium lindaniclasticum]